MAMANAANPTVGFVTVCPEVYGAEKSLHALLAHWLRLAGEEGEPVPRLICPQGPVGDLLGQTLGEDSCLSAPMFPMRFSGPQAVRQVPAVFAGQTVLWRRLLQWEPSTIHANGLQALAWLASWLAARGRGRPPVVLHLRDWPRRPGLHRVLLRFADVVVVPSRAMKEAASVFGKPVVGLRNPIFGPNPPPQPSFTPFAERPRLAAVVGQFLPRKGQDLVLSALEQAPEAFADWKFAFFGSSPPCGSNGYARALRQRVESNPRLSASVSFRGYVDDVPWSEVGVLLVPSRCEPYGRVAAEALWHGVPVIASDTGGLRDIVRPGRNGLCFSEGDARALAGECGRLLRGEVPADELIRQGMIDSHRWWAREESGARRLMALHRRLWARKAGHGGRVPR
ncbi:MAG: glycosyltransferase [Sumerlaeia bacterium]